MGRRLAGLPPTTRSVRRGGTGLILIVAAWLAGVSPAVGQQPFASPSKSSVAVTARSAETLSLAGLEDQFQSLADRLASSVVAISASTNAVDREELVREGTLTPDRLATVFSKSARTVGTGLVIDADGYILTNDHVVADVQAIWVTTDDGKVYPAFVVGSDPRSDLAVLKIPATNLAPVTFAEKSPRRGQWTLALGNPYGLSSEGRMCMSVGIISATGRSLPKLADAEKRLYSNLIQTTAEINPGNSGGPLFNLAGEVIGVNTAVVLPQKQANGIGFAIPMNDEVRPVIRELMAGREIIHGYLGVVVSRPSAADARAAGLPPDSGGAIVDGIEVGSPAAASGLHEGDYVTNLGGRPIFDGDHLVRLVSRSPVDRPVALSVRRAGRPVTVNVQLRQRIMATAAVTRETQRLRWRGLLLGPVPGNWSASSIKSAVAGVMVLAVDRASRAVPTGVTQGSIITRIGGLPVAGVEGLQKILNDLPAERCSVEVAEGTGAPVVATTR